jgi:probable blue pigment (indigoidine) exporter
MKRSADILLTALAPAIWGSTYLVTTEFLPAGYPITLAVLRALPAGLLMLALTRCLPPRDWLGRVLILGGLNFAVFWTLLFVTAYRLPGGVAATLGAIQPLIVIFLASALLGTAIHAIAIAAALSGAVGVALLVLGPEAALDPIGVVAGLWQPPVSALIFTAWQLTAGGVILLPLALWFEPPLPTLTMTNIGGLVWLGLIGSALSYWLWFRGIARLDPGASSMLIMMSPMTAVLIGWAWLGQGLTLLQAFGAVVVFGAVWISQRAAMRKTA